MPKCPKCGEEIDYLDYECEEVSVYEVRLSPSGDSLEWKRVDYVTVEKFNAYTCPECGAEIAYRPIDVIDFLKGEQA